MGAGVAEEALLLHWPSLALQAGQEDQALEAAAAACQALPSSSAAWQQRLSLQARHTTLQVCIAAVFAAPCCPVLPFPVQECCRAWLSPSSPLCKLLLRCSSTVKTGSPSMNGVTKQLERRIDIVHRSGHYRVHKLAVVAAYSHAYMVQCMS